MVKLQCYHKGCGHRWNYTGKAKKWICCSGCRSPLSIKKLKEKGFWGVK